MRRCFIAILVLHLLVGVGLFVSEDNGAALGDDAQRIALLVVDGPVPQAHTGAAVDTTTAAEAGLADVQPESPEALNQEVPTLAPAPARVVPLTPVLVAHQPPTLDGLQRPPRFSRAA